MKGTSLITSKDGQCSLAYNFSTFQILHMQLQEIWGFHHLQPMVGASLLGALGRIDSGSPYTYFGTTYAAIQECPCLFPSHVLHVLQQCAFVVKECGVLDWPL